MEIKIPVRDGESEPVLFRETLDTILKCVRDVRYGTITLVIHDGKIVQIEKHEKIRV
jgi:hypothetical protein